MTLFRGISIGWPIVSMAIVYQVKGLLTGVGIIIEQWKINIICFGLMIEIDKKKGKNMNEKKYLKCKRKIGYISRKFKLKM